VPLRNPLELFDRNSGAKFLMSAPKPKQREVRSGSNSEVAGLEQDVRSTLKNRHRHAGPACPKSADFVAKVPKGTAANFPPKNETSDNRRSVQPQTRYRSRP
jgi:hypothetical protein